jgi:RHS repeat-associated protein
MLSQNPSTYVFPSVSTPVPANLSVDSYTRAINKINLVAGFKYGFVASSATNLLNLNIGANPNYVSSAYLGSAINPQVNGCTNGLPPDPNKPVGETLGDFSVSKFGAATYNIPIVISPGTNKLEPEINILYNSQYDIGILGAGVKLDGLSAITRAEKTPMQDGRFEGIKMSTLDAFSLDGNRLFVSSGNNYYSEEEKFQTITSNGNQGNGPLSFEVKDRNGYTFDYGSTNDSRLVGVADNSVLSWFLSMVTDEYGNYMRYYYKKLDGEIVIDRIEYTGNSLAGLQPYNTVNFEYIDLAEKTSFYIAGIEFKRTQLLKSITSLAGSDLVRKYIFDYNWDNNGTYLASVKETDSDGRQLNPTNFCWADPNDFSGIKNTQGVQLFSNSSDYIGVTAVPADLNGDGFSDYVCISRISSGALFRMMRNDFKSNYGTTNNDISFTQADLVGESNVHHLLSNNVTDEDNDNKEEVYSVFEAGTGSSANTTHLSSSYSVVKTYASPSTYLYTLAMTTNVSTFNTGSSFDILFSPTQFFYDTGDHDGDGVNDILRIDPFSINLTTASGTAIYPITTSKTIVRPFSFNNDGYTDYLVLEYANRNTVNLKVITLSLSGTNQIFTQVHSLSLAFPNNPSTTLEKNLLHNFAIGDLNGDGIDEIFYLNETFDKLSVLKGTGTGFLATQEITSFTSLPYALNVFYFIDAIDIDGDGRCDIKITDNVAKMANNPANNYFTYFSMGDFMIKGGSYSGNWKSVIYKYYVSNGRKLSKFQKFFGNYKASDYYYLKSVDQNDLNGDGVFDGMSLNSPGNDFSVGNNVNGRTKYSISTILSPLKKRLDIRYANLKSEIYVKSGGIKEEVYSKQSTNAYNAPLYNFKPSLYCVNNTIESSGYNAQIVHYKKYKYSDGIFHSKGRGFLGFEEIIQFDRLTLLGNIRRTTFNPTFNVALNTEDLEAKMGVSTISGVSTYGINYNHLMRRKTKTIALIPRNAKGFFVSTGQIVEKDYLNGTKAVTSLVYSLNEFGNVASKTTNYGWTGPTIRSEQSNYTYIFKNGYYKLLSETNSQVQGTDQPYVRTTDYAYDSQGRLVNMLNDQANNNIGNQKLNTAFSQFNLFGSPTKTTVSAGDVLPRTSEIVYEPTGRFAVKKINAIGNFEEFKYDTKYGNITEVKDITGLVIQYFYDGLGRLIKTILPNFATNTVSYAWDTPGSTYPYSQLRFGVYSVKTETEANGFVKTYHTSTGEVLRTETQDFAGQTVVRDIKYNSTNNPNYPNGVILQITEPHYIAQPKYLVNGFDYETIFFRPLTQTTYSMNNGNLVNTGIHIQIDYVTQSTDNSYFPKYVTITNQKNQLLGILSNSAGQIEKVKNNYPNLYQMSTYLYNSNGQPKSVTLTNSINSGQSIVHSFLYDGLGNKNQLTDPSAGVLTYGYNTLGELLSQTTPNGSFTFGYDNLGRLISKSGSLSGSTTFQYVANGNGKQQLENIFGPVSTTELKYDNFNRLVENKEVIISNNKILKSNYAYDTYGREIQSIYPSGFVKKNVYNSQGHLNTITDDNNNVIWQLIDKDALGRIKEFNYGNNINTKNSFDDLNYLTEINHGNGSIYKQMYQFNGLTGNLNFKQFQNYVSNTNLKEFFTFDGLDRLTQINQVTPQNTSIIQQNNIVIDVLGNITHKDDAGDMHYGLPNKPFVLSQVTNATNNISLNTLSASYNEFNKIMQLSEMGSNKQLDIVYGNNDERIRMDYKIGGTNQYTRYYGQNYDRQETTNGFKEWTYIYAPSGLCAVLHNNNGAKQLNYALNDHLGSPVLLTDQNQNILEEYSFDSWGRRRNPIDWSYTNVPVATRMIRGYTLHEQLDEFALINMNGRVYDPVLGRFIQPDNEVQTPELLQNFNRYAYCLNNPLRYTDPTGNNYVDKPVVPGEFFPHVITLPEFEVSPPETPDGGGFNTDIVDIVATAIGVNTDVKEGVIEFAKKSGDIGKAGEKYLSLTQAAGKMMGVTSAVLSWKDWNKNPSTGALVKAFANTGLVFLRVNPFVGVGLGILDLTGGSDWFYNQIGSSIDNIGGPRR